MMTILILVAVLILAFLLAFLVIGLLELRKDTNDTRSLIDKQNEWMRKGLERANHEIKPK